MKAPTLSLVLLFMVHLANGQSHLSGRTIDSNGEAIPFCNVLLLNPQDSSLIKGELSDENGLFDIAFVYNEPIMLSCSFIGYNTYYSDEINAAQNEHIEVGDISLSQGLELEAIQVVAKKPLYERKIDRMVVNVASSVTSSGGTALEILEKSPGIIVNRQNNVISLLGKDGVVVMINGKINYQPLEGIVQMLDGMSADNIEKIELITTPPANLDAEGNAGYINIVLKENPDLGLNGNISLSAGVGEGETGTGNFSFNYRKNKINVFGNYSYFLQSQYQEFYNFRRVLFAGDETISEVLTERDPTDRNHNARLGIDFSATDKTTIGILVAAYDNKWTMDAFNTAGIRTNGMYTDSLTLDNTERNQWKHIMGNINIEHKLTDNSKLNLNIDRLYYEDENPTIYDTRFLTEAGNEYFAEATRSDKYTPIDISVAQIDYENTVNEFIGFQTGVKAALSTFENDVSVEVFESGQWNFIDRFTNQSDLEEKIYAAYASVDYKLDEANTFKVGLRYEYTDSELNTVKEGTVVDREFGQLFPTVYYNRTINENQSLGMAYNRRITRPTFNDMAPFAIFLDPNTYFFGNAGLQPSISDNIKLDYRINEYYLSLQYSKEDSTIARFQDFVDPETNQQSFRPINLSDNTIITGSLSFPVRVTRHWEMQNNIIASHTEIISFYEGVEVSIDNFNYNLNSTQSLILDKGYSFELSGFYNSPNLWGRAKLDPIWGVNFGAQKKFDNGSSLRFNIRDMFNSIVWEGGTQLLEQGFETDGYFDFSNRTFIISYSTSFGNKKLKDTRNRTTGSEEERNRIN